MPEISRFYGIVVAMYWADHPRPHLHAEYAGVTARLEIGTGALLSGALPPRVLRLVRQWEAMHREELMVNWSRARSHEPLLPIAPLR